MQINTFIETLKFKQDRSSSGIGTIQNYFVTFFPGSYGYSVVPYFTLPLTETITDEFIESLQKALEAYDIIVKHENDVLILVVNHSLTFLRPDYTGVILQALERTAGHLSAEGFTQPRMCSVCGEPLPDTYHYAHGVHRPIHRSCLPSAQPDASPLVPEPLPAEDVGAQSFSVILGLSLAIVFAIPSIITAVYYPIFYTFLLIFIPLGGVFGTKWGRGTVARGTFRRLNVIAYSLGIAIILWRTNLTIASLGESLFGYLANVAYLISFFIDLVVGTLIITLGMAVFRPLLPIRKL